MTTDEWDDVNQRVAEEWREETTPFERVYEVIETTHDGQSAAGIADRALVSEPTARRHLETLVTTGFAETTQEGRTTLYRRDADRVLVTRIQELRDDVDRDELLDGIREMKGEVHEYEERYDARSPEELARQLPNDAAEEWEDVTAWKTARRNLAVAQAALAYDEASEELSA